MEDAKKASEDAAKAEKPMLVSVEVDYNDMIRRKAWLKRCRATVIENASGELLKHRETLLGASAVVTTDGWIGFLIAPSGKWHNVEDSAHGANFQALCLHIINPKNWMRGIHHHVSTDSSSRISLSSTSDSTINCKWDSKPFKSLPPRQQLRNSRI